MSFPQTFYVMLFLLAVAVFIVSVTPLLALLLFLLFVVDLRRGEILDNEIVSLGLVGSVVHSYLFSNVSSCVFHRRLYPFFYFFSLLVFIVQW